MTYEEMAALMPGADETAIKAALKAVNDAAQAAIEAETKGLVENKEKLLTQMTKLKDNQIPDGFDKEGYAKYLTDSEEFAKKQKDLADAELEGKGQWDALRMQLTTSHATALETLSKESTGTINSLRTALDKELIENNAIKAIEVEQGNSLFLLPHMRGQMKTVQAENGEFEVHVLDKEGNRRMLDDATTPFTVKDLVAELKANDIFAPAFPSQNGGSGNDADPGGKGGTGANPWKTDSKNVTEQARINKENPTLAAQMMKAAGVV